MVYVYSQHPRAIQARKERMVLCERYAFNMDSSELRLCMDCIDDALPDSKSRATVHSRRNRARAIAQVLIEHGLLKGRLSIPNRRIGGLDQFILKYKDLAKQVYFNTVHPVTEDLSDIMQECL